MSTLPTFFGARQIAAWFVYLCETWRIPIEDMRHTPPDPTRNQVRDGLILEYSEGLPSILWTPWGRWEFLRRVLSPRRGRILIPKARRLLTLELLWAPAEDDLEYSSLHVVSALKPTGLTLPYPIRPKPVRGEIEIFAEWRLNQLIFENQYLPSGRFLRVPPGEILL